MISNLLALIPIVLGTTVGTSTCYISGMIYVILTDRTDSRTV